MLETFWNIFKKKSHRAKPFLLHSLYIKLYKELLIIRIDT